MNCNICDKIFKNKAGLSSHLRSCDIFNKKCQYCNKDFYNSSNLKKHLEDKSCKGYLLYIEDQLNKLAVKQSELREAEKGTDATKIQKAQEELIATNNIIKILEKKLQTVNDINRGDGDTIKNLSEEEKDQKSR